MKKVTQTELRTAYESRICSLGAGRGRSRYDSHGIMVSHMAADLVPLAALLDRPMRASVGDFEASARSLATTAQRAIDEHHGSKVTRVELGDVETSCHLSKSIALPEGGYLVRFRPFVGAPSHGEFFDLDQKEGAAEYHDHLVTGLG